MKKQLIISSMVTLSIIFLFNLSLHSQGDWQWARSFTGYDGSITYLPNNITRSVFDSYGNIYIAGNIGDDVKFNNQEQLSTDPKMRNSGLILAKLDNNGNLLWRKTIKSTECISNTYWMDIVGDTSIVLFANSYGPKESEDSLLYLDTLIVGLSPNPILNKMPKGGLDCFISFDLNGNKQNEVFIQHKQIYTQGNESDYQIFEAISTIPFVIDYYGNTYFCVTPFIPQKMDTLKLLINNNKEYSYKVGDIQDNAFMLKFNSNFDLIWIKEIIKDTFCLGDGNSSLIFNPEISSISKDNDKDNCIYLTGAIQKVRESDTNFYMEMDLGSNQKLKFNDIGWGSVGFTIKYDSSGNAVWANQIYGEKRFYPITPSFYNYSTSVVNSKINQTNEYLYIIGEAGYCTSYSQNGERIIDTTAFKLFFDDSTQLILEIDSLSDYTTSNVFFAKLNIQTGKYISHGKIKCNLKNSNIYQNDIPIILHNNQVFTHAFYWGYLNGVRENYYIGKGRAGLALVRWKENGELIEAINIPVYNDISSVHSGNAILRNNGDLFVTGTYKKNITFGDNVLSGSNAWANVYMAKYNDISFVHPYGIGIESISTNKGENLLIYPNPTKDIVNIESKGEIINSYTLYNIGGQTIIKSEKLKVKSEKLDLSNLPKGVYIIKVRTEKNVYSHKVIKN